MKIKKKLQAKPGALPDYMIRLISAEGWIDRLSSGKVGSSSLDLSLHGEMYQVEALPFPTSQQKIQDLLVSVPNSAHRIEDPLMRDRLYIARLTESLNFPSMIYGYCNPKSTSGRDDLHVRLLADGVPQYDTVPGNFNGDLWVSIRAQSFTTLVQPNLSLNQLRIFSGDSRIKTREEIMAIHKESPLILDLQGELIEDDFKFFDPRDGSIYLPIDMESDIVGYEAIQSGEILDMSADNSIDPSNFFRSIPRPKDGVLFLKKGNFYILSCGLNTRVPVNLSCEMRPVDDRLGEFRAHYAGYIDDGWGIYKNEKSPRGDTLTLEVRPYEDMYIRKGQLIARVVYEKMFDLAEKPYTQKKSNYTEQCGPRLAKQFKAY